MGHGDDGPASHIIKSRVSGKCLIRGNNGHAAYPSTYLWGENPDKIYCGFRSKEELIANGQALWDLGILRTAYRWPNHLMLYHGNPKMPGYSDGYINWDSGSPRFSTSADHWVMYFVTQPPR